MRFYIILFLLISYSFSQNTNRKYIIIEASVLEECNPDSKKYNKKTVDELMSLGNPFGTGLINKEHRVSNDGKLVIVEYHNCIEKVTKKEQDDAKLAVSAKPDYQSSKEKKKYEKQKAHDNKCADKKTAKYISDAFRWYKYFKDDEDIYDYLNKNSKNWYIDEETSKETGVKNAIH